MVEDRTGVKRHLRFASDPNWLGWISVNTKLDEFKSDIVGLVVDESQSGCSIVFRETPEFTEGAIYCLKVGELDPINAQLKWSREIDPGVIRVGFQYLL